MSGTRACALEVRSTPRSVPVQAAAAMQYNKAFIRNSTGSKVHSQGALNTALHTPSHKHMQQAMGAISDYTLVSYKCVSAKLPCRLKILANNTIFAATCHLEKHSPEGEASQRRVWMIRAGAPDGNEEA